MNKEKQIHPGTKDKKQIQPGSIKGRLDVPDIRERRDGPGGN